VTARTAPDELLAQWSRLLMGGLLRAGVRDVIISPGSRSTPFVWAALHTPGLECHSAYDERSAGFFALGRARQSGRPSALLCTSGSAAANYFPALIEASLARVPLLVITADRPLEMQDAAAAQTIDQIGLYGDYVRRFYELGTPDETPSALAGLLRLVQQAVAVSLHPEPGPVHLNARARKPLEPPSGESQSELAGRVAALLERPAVRFSPPETQPAQAAVATLARACQNAQRGLIVAGPEAAGSDCNALLELSERTGFPLLCEATSQLRFAAQGAASVVDGFDWILRSSALRQELAPDLVLRFGAPPTSGGLEQLVGSAREYHLIAGHGFPDAQGGARSITLSSSGAAARALCAALERPAPETSRGYAARWQALNRAAWAAVETTLAASDGLHEGAAVRAAVDALPPGSLLVLGNSLPVREVDQYVPAAPRGISVACQRGANGIDGVVSGAAGAASVFAGKTLLLIGDVSFLHDLGGLDLVRRAERPFVVLVLDNGGGRIFEQLAMGPRFAGQPAIERFWLTPPAAELAHAAALFGIPCSDVSSGPALQTALGVALSRPGATVILARVAADSARRAVEAIPQLLAGGAA
jgi:2-succinyl-5-enolpyruvyl-6-hydroxy-3-cyclohexene-1-carboxylate synthase